MRTAPAALLLAALFAGQDAHAQEGNSDRGTTASFGYTVGGIATQRVLLPDGFQPAELPEAARASAWLERRPRGSNAPPMAGAGWP